LYHQDEAFIDGCAARLRVVVQNLAPLSCWFKLMGKRSTGRLGRFVDPVGSQV
jgi:hypothetical protein